MTTNKSKTKFTLQVSPKQLFIIQCSLEQFRDIKDSEYRKATDIAGKLLEKLPDAGLKWDDVAS